MSIYMYVMDNEYNLLAELGSLDMFDIFKINKEAEKQNLNCLPFLNAARGTIYNQVQITQIKKEINILKKNENLKNILITLENATNQIPNNPQYYLRFFGE